MNFKRDIKKAKEVPLQRIYPDELKPVGQGLLRGPCPLHGDNDKPNFTVYTSSNTWWCFACSKGRDSIDLLMELKGLDFKEAVKELSSWK